MAEAEGTRQLNPHTIAGQQFFLPTEIQPKSIIGKGSYGVVVSALDTCTNQKVAIKRIKPYSGDDWEARHTLREIQLMRLLGFHPNIVSLNDLWAREEDNELYLTMELMDSDLHQIIQSKQKLSEPHHQCLMKQLLLGVQAMHKCGVLHRDLKPGNLLVTRDCQLRITDFGLARAWTAESPDRSDTEVGLMTEYVVTRWYRCPELLLAPHLPYHGAIDMWSVGCIFGELVTRQPLFPGKSYVHQVQVILDKLGTPSPSEYGFVPRDDAASFLKRQQHRQGMSWSQILPKASEQQKEFLQRLLIWDPNKRMNVDKALSHPWLQEAPPIPVEIVELSELMEHKRKQNITFSFEDTSTSLPSLKRQIEEEVVLVQTRKLEGTRSSSPQGPASAAGAGVFYSSTPSSTAPESRGTRTPTSAAPTATPSSASSLGSRNRGSSSTRREAPGPTPTRTGVGPSNPMPTSTVSGANRKTARRKETGSATSSSLHSSSSAASVTSSSQIESLRRRIDQMDMSAKPHQRGSLPSIRGGILSRIAQAGSGGTTLTSTSARGRVNERLGDAIRYSHGVSGTTQTEAPGTVKEPTQSAGGRKLARGTVRELRQRQLHQHQRRPLGY